MPYIGYAEIDWILLLVTTFYHKKLYLTAKENNDLNTLHVIQSYCSVVWYENRTVSFYLVKVKMIYHRKTAIIMVI